jgi:Putative zinc-finger
MSCHDAREWLSDLLDDALASEARAQVEAHLAGCAECRRELERLRATVSLLRAVERPLAPAGFVDRVLEAARPAPWYRRLLDWLAGVRLLRFPVEAVAVVLVASLAVYVFQGTPALRRAARPEISQDHLTGSSLSTEARTAAPPGVLDAGPNTEREQTKGSAQVPSESLRLPAPVPPTVQPMPPLAAPGLSLEQQRLMKGPATAEELAAAARNSVLLSSDPALPEPAPSAPAAPTPGAVFSQADRSGSVEGRLQFLRKDNAAGDGGAGERATSQSPPVAPGPVPPPELRDRMAREKAQERAARPAPVPMPASRPPAPSATRIVPSAHVVGRLTVKDRQAADRELAELLSRVGGTETGRHAEAGGDTVGLVVPRAAYPAFAQGLGRIGSWLPETEPPELPDRVPITLRITQ